jgi:hypothetical protein
MAHAYVPVTNHYHRAALSPVAALPALPIAVWEFSLGGCLTFRGFKASPVTVGM